MFLSLSVCYKAIIVQLTLFLVGVVFLLPYSPKHNYKNTYRTGDYRSYNASEILKAISYWRVTMEQVVRFTSQTSPQERT